MTARTVRLNPDLEINRLPISGDDFCVVIDNFLADPHALIDYACEHADEFYVPEMSYPGLNLVLDEQMVADFHRYARTQMARQFSFLRGNASLTTGLSMMTFRPHELSIWQRLCHTDIRDVRGRRKFAALVYLYDSEELGGTAFYRWKRPDIVQQALTLDARDSTAAAEYLAEHSETFRQPPRYLTDSNDLAERLLVVAPRFNRMVFYSGEIPHSAHITSPESLTTDFRTGRLTLNSFASVVPK